MNDLTAVLLPAGLAMFALGVISIGVGVPLGPGHIVLIGLLLTGAGLVAAGVDR